MGIGPQAIRLMARLRQEGHLHNLNTVIELGAQDIVPGGKNIHALMHDLTGVHVSAGTPISAAAVYQAFGLMHYQCIDSNGHNRAHVFDLNHDIRQTYGFTEEFDLVTNHGTTEHVFNQHAAFLNVHNLCAVGGLMIHGLPFQGYVDHGLYNYQPFFYRSLATANQYDLVGIYLNLHDSFESILPYNELLLKYLYCPPGTNTLLFVVFRKTSPAPFRMSFDDRFGIIEEVRQGYSHVGEAGVSRGQEPSADLVEEYRRAARQLQSLMTDGSAQSWKLHSAAFWALRKGWRELRSLVRRRLRPPVS